MLAGLVVSRAEERPIVLVIHGGAGVKREDLRPEREVECRAVLEQAVRAGFRVLEEGGRSLEAVQVAIEVLEDSPVFNAGRGSVLTAAGGVEMDASLMDGSNLKAGAVAGVRGVRHPIRLAEVVMTRTPHVLMAGAGAEALGREAKLVFEEESWFITPEQRERLERVKKASAAAGDRSRRESWSKVGTVGAVALDGEGHLAAGTSTGGMVNKRSGRVGDSPIIGAGTYAEDGVCAVSCTGHGEFFIRNVVAYDVAARMKHGGEGLEEAAETVVRGRLAGQGGSGGLIAVDSKGRITTVFNTPGMFRAEMTLKGGERIAIFED